MDTIFELFKGLIQGVVQGITEWLPISSTGHMILLNEWLSMDSPDFFEVFKVVIQLGSILAVLVLYFHRLNPFAPSKAPVERRETWSLWAKVIVASVPVAILGLLLDEFLEEKLSTPLVIAVALIVYGILFIIMESVQRTPKYIGTRQVGFRTALCIGAFQALALIPGTSRSGATILGATLLGTSRATAAEFSFFMAIPAMLGASGWKLLKFVLKGIHFSALEWAVLLVGTVVAFLVSLLVIKFLMNYIKKHDFKIFGYYRIVLGFVLIALWFAGVLK